MDHLVNGSPLLAFGRALAAQMVFGGFDFFSQIEWEPSFRRLCKSPQSQRDLDSLAMSLLKHAAPRRRRSNAGAAFGVRQSLWSIPQIAPVPRARQLIRTWENFAESSADPPGWPGSSGHRNGDAGFRRFAPSSARRLSELVSAAARWLKRCNGGTPVEPLETLLLFEILRDAGLDLPRRLAFDLWRAGLLAAMPYASSHHTTILETELAWQAGLLFAPVAGSGLLRDAAARALRQQLMDLTDSSGVPSADILGQLPEWLISMVRAREWGRRFSKPLLDPPHEKRLRALLTAIAQLCGVQGRLPLSNGSAADTRHVWSALAGSVFRRDTSVPAARRFTASGRSAKNGSYSNRLNGAKPVPRNGAARPKSKPPSFQSDTSRIACLRSDWKPEANSLVVCHNGELPQLEFSAHGHTLISGLWGLQVRIDGQPVSWGDSWHCSCWSSDADADFLELQWKFGNDVRIERQILLTRADDVLFLADAVMGPRGTIVECVSRLPLTGGVFARMQSRTRECRLTTGGIHARVFPTGLPCRREISSAGGLTAGDGWLEVRQVGVGAVYSPVVLEWSRRRRRSPVRWLPLTVAQNGSALGSHEASAYRLQMGDCQWLAYRSLSRIVEPRTVLGYHTMCETAIGRFVPGGNVEPIMLIEQSSPPGSAS